MMSSLPVTASVETDGTPAGGRIVTVLVVVLAAILTATDVVVLHHHGIDRVWAWLQLPVLLMAWAAPFAWRAGRWVAAAICLLATLGGLWGYFYLPPLGALVVGGEAISRAVRTRSGGAMFTAR
jgi:hypothetical protein